MWTISCCALERGITKRPSTDVRPAPTECSQARDLSSLLWGGVCTRERGHLMLMRGDGVRNWRDGFPPQKRLARTETTTYAQIPSPARNIKRDAHSPPPHTITLNIHANAWEDVQGRPTTVQCGTLKILRGMVVAWVWLKPPASPSAAEGGPPRHTGVCSRPLPPRRDHYSPCPYGDTTRGPAEPG